VVDQITRNKHIPSEEDLKEQPSTKRSRAAAKMKKRKLIEQAEAAETEATRKEADKRRWTEYKEQLHQIGFDDLYGLLNLSHLDVRATDDDIKKHYRQVSRIAHPDKAAADDREDADERYKAIQNAYATLLEPQKRRIYDSNVDFDDTIPAAGEGTKDDDDFFVVYRPAFRRNARWSANHPVPSLGDMKTDFAEVDRFYDFWLSFSSWREFRHEDEYDPEDAGSREEKRWMERHNAKLTAKMKKAEVSRVRKLVEDAMKKDPRIIAHKAAIRAEKEAIKAAKEREKMRKKKKEDRRERREQEKEERERQAKEEAERLAKKERAQAKRHRKSIRTVCRSGQVGEVDEEQLKRLTDVPNADLKRIHDVLCPTGNPTNPLNEEQIVKGKEMLLNQVQLVMKAEEEEKERLKAELAAERLAKRKQKEKKINKKEWSIEEENVLIKAVKKFPGGAGNRWQLIARMVNHIGDRTAKECIAKSKELELRKNDERNKAFEQYKLSQNKPDTATGAAAGAAAVSSSSTSPAKTKKSKKGSKSDKKQSTTNGTTASDSSTPAAAAAAGTVVEWNADQQAAFEKALRTVPKGADRWDNIAALVPGKSKKQCVKRFKEIRAQILAKKQAAQ
jgi:DnaJ homolog subfamily C member 2